MLNRRQLLSLAAAGVVLPSGLWSPRAAHARPTTPERKFLFIYAYGGWDTTKVFTPKFDAAYIDMEDDAELAEANGISFVDHADRPSVRTFFETYGDRTAVVNGMEVRSVTHERCQRLAFTGGSESDGDDWPVSIASNTELYYPVPHLVLAGPAFTGRNAANVVRAGEVGQITELLDGSALSLSDTVFTAPDPTAAKLEDEFLKSRLLRFQELADRGAPRRLGGLYHDAIQNLETLVAVGSEVNLNPEPSGCSRDTAADAACAFNAFEIELARCALAKHMGWCSMSWDTHANNDQYQTVHFEELFGYLNEIMADLDQRTGASGAPLKDEVTICVFSEMGRHPQDVGGGRGHWTFTSFMLIGAGVKGGQVIGEVDDNFAGRSVDLPSGQVSDTGVGLLPGHMGATLMQLAGVDYAELLPTYEPIWAAVEDS